MIMTEHPKHAEAHIDSIVKQEEDSNMRMAGYTPLLRID
jgi:hypothetical protein